MEDNKVKQLTHWRNNENNFYVQFGNYTCNSSHTIAICFTARTKINFITNKNKMFFLMIIKV